MMLGGDAGDGGLGGGGWAALTRRGLVRAFVVLACVVTLFGAFAGVTQAAKVFVVLQSIL